MHKLFCMIIILYQTYGRECGFYDFSKKNDRLTTFKLHTLHTTADVACFRSLVNCMSPSHTGFFSINCDSHRIPSSSTPRSPPSIHPFDFALLQVLSSTSSPSSILIPILPRFVIFLVYFPTLTRVKGPFGLDYFLAYGKWLMLINKFLS